MEIKICGITKENEIQYLNDAKVNYAGFVIFEKSKRYITVDGARELFPKLDTAIKKVAVTVSPSVELAKQIEEAGFDVLQVHKVLSAEVIEAIKIPVWYAFNIAKADEMEEKEKFLNSLPIELASQVEALVVDGAEYGSGKTFDWSKSKRLKKAGAQSPPNNIFNNRKFILAGGLNASNVVEGMEIFAPDMVDISSGVEGENGKDEILIKEFVERVRNNE